MLINKYKKLLTGTCISSEHLISLLGEHPCIKGKSAEYLSPGVFFLLKALQAGAEQWYTTSLHTRYRLVGNSTPHFGVLCGDSGRSRAASLKESEQGKIALAEYVLSRAEPFKKC